MGKEDKISRVFKKKETVKTIYNKLNARHGNNKNKDSSTK